MSSMNLHPFKINSDSGDEKSHFSMARGSALRMRKLRQLKNRSEDPQSFKKKLESLKKVSDKNPHVRLFDKDRLTDNKNGSQKNNSAHSSKFMGKNSTTGKKFEKVTDFGVLGLDLEELRVGIEIKYDEMIRKLEYRLEVLKKHLSNIMDKVNRDFKEQIMNEKELNLDNLVKLESFLATAIRKINDDSD